MEVLTNGYAESYKERLKWLSAKVNRSKGQTEFLFQLVNGDFEKLKALEVQLKNCFIYYCPNDVEEVEKIMALTPKSNWFKLDDDYIDANRALLNELSHATMLAETKL